MGKEWFSSKELTAVDGLPSTTQGINRRARVEKWRSRKRSGVQGKAIEYHINSFPEFVRTHLKKKKFPDSGDINMVESAKIWLSAYSQFTPKEQEIVLAWVLRHGLRDLLSFISLTEKD